MAIRVKLTIDPRYAARFAQLYAVSEELEALGIEVGTDFEVCDLQLIQSSLLKSGEVALSALDESPVLIYERSDAATLGDDVFQRKLIARPEVRSWLKEFAFRDPSLHNEMMTEGRYHYTLINDDSQRTPPKPPTVMVARKDLEKITSLQPIYMFPQFDYCRQFDRRLFRTRRTELFFAGTMEYNHQFVKYHRYLAGMAIERLENVVRLIGYGRVFDKRQFQDSLQQAKIFLSPYGLGEFSWKDYEAILAGCVLIKPTANFVTTYKFDIYKKGMRCIECKPDFSDLQDIVEDVLARESHYEQFAEEARQSLLAACTLDGYADDIAAAFRKALSTDPAVSTDVEKQAIISSSVNEDEMGDRTILIRDVMEALGEEFLPAKAAKAVVQGSETFAKVLTSSLKRYSRSVEDRVWERLPNQWVMTEVAGRCKLWLNLADGYAQQILRSGEPRSNLVSIVLQYLTEGTCFVDAGANIGWHALHVALDHPNAVAGQIIAIEPQADVANFMRRSFTDSGVVDRVEVIQAALGAETGEVIIQRMRSNLAGAIAFKARARETGEVAPQRTLDDIAQNRGPISVIKLSVEGSEYLAMKGAQQVLRTDMPLIIGSLNCRKLLQISGVTIAHYVAFMSEFGYSPMRIVGDSIDAPLDLGVIDDSAIISVAFVPPKLKRELES